MEETYCTSTDHRREKKGETEVVQLLAVTRDKEVADGTNSGQRNTWEELMREPLAIDGLGATEKEVSATNKRSLHRTGRLN